LSKVETIEDFDDLTTLPIDEAGIERIEHLLWPLWFGVDRQAQAA
jgi:AAA domain